MAEDKDKTVVAAPDGGAAETPAKAGGKKKLILFGGIGVGILVIGVVLAVFVLKPMMSGSGGEQKAAEPAKTETHAEAAKKTEKPQKAEGEKKKEGEKGGGEGLIFTIKDIVVNPAGTGGSRFLSVSFAFEFGSKDAASQFEGKEPQVRDVLITILSSKTLADLTDPKQKEVMRLQIKKRLMQTLNTEDLAGVYFTDFVLQ